MTQRFGDDPQAIPGGRVIAKGIIKTYTAGTHKADVQLVGSHPTIISAVRLATDIPAADVVAGRQCTVLFLDPANQDDAVILTIQGALPSGGGGVTDHGALTGLLDDDHTQYGALAQAETWAALQTFNAGIKLAAGQAIQDSGGAARYTPKTTGPENTLTGGLAVTGFMRIGSATAPATNEPLSAINTTAAASGFARSIFQLADNGTGAAVAIIALDGRATTSKPSGGAAIVSGLNFAGIHAAVANTTNLRAITLVVQSSAGAGTISASWVALFSAASWSGSVPATAYGLQIGDQGKAGITTVYGLKIDDILAGAAQYLIEAGPTAIPNLRLVAGAPAANLSQLWLAINNGAVVLRQVEVGAAGSGGVGFRILRVLN